MSNLLSNGLVLCQGCEEDYVIAGVKYCVGCDLIHASLEEEYARGAIHRPVEAGGRIDVGVDEMPAPEFDRDNSLGGLVAAAVATVFGGAGLLAVFCVLGWYGPRLIARAGIWLAS